MAPVESFKKCNHCEASWAAREDFIHDPDVVLIGYQANFVNLEKGLFLFNHSCQSTLSVNVLAFSDMSSQPIFRQKKSGSDECSGFCLHKNDFRPCPVQCECVYVREILQLLKNDTKELLQTA